MVSDDDDDNEEAEWAHEPRAGNDTTPLFTLVHDTPYSNGKLTGQARTTSAAYMAFLRRNKEAQSNGRK